MKNRLNFYPSLLNPVFTRICQSFSGAIALLAYRLQLRVDEDSLAQLNQIKEHRIVFLVNHPSFDDGIVLFLLSTRWGELFNYLVAYESFQGLTGKFLQLIGAYSVQRGLADRQSIEYTINLLQKPQTRLVVFPEGGCSYQNDTVMPFRPGAIQLAFKALEKLTKEHNQTPPFYLVPITLKYRYFPSISQSITKTLTKLESHYQIPSSNEDWYLRLRKIAEQVLISMEQEYSLTPTTSDWNHRINQLRETVLLTCAQQLNLTFRPDLPARERIYKMQSLIESPDCPVETVQLIQKASLRLLNFDAIYDGYVADQPTPERFMDTLTRLEREAFWIDRPSAKAQRKALITVGEPINLQDYYQSYQANRTEILTKLTQEAQQRVQSPLKDLG